MPASSLPVRLLRRLLSPVVQSGGAVFFDRALSARVPRATPPEGFFVRTATAADLPLLTAALPGRAPEVLRERFANGDRCWVAIDPGGHVAHASWVTATSAWLSGLELKLTVHPREVYAYDFHTRPALRGLRLFASVRALLCDTLQAEGVERLFSCVPEDDIAGCAAASTWEFEAGRLHYLRLRGTRGKVWGRCPFSLSRRQPSLTPRRSGPGPGGPFALPGGGTQQGTADGARPAPRLRTELVSDAAALLALRPVWDELLARSDVDHPFLTHDWICAWWEAFGAGRSLRVVTVWAGSTCVAIAPLMGERATLYGLRMRVVQLMGNDHTPRAGLIVASPSCEVPGELCAEVCGAVLDAIGALREGWDVVLLSQLAEGSTARQLQEFAQKKSLSTGVWRSVASPRLRLNGTWESYLASLRPKQRANLRNRINRLRKTGPLALEEVRGGPALQAALDDGLRLEGAAWKGLEGTSIASSPLTSRFYRRFAESAAAQGWLSLLFLTVGGERIAFCYALRFAGTLHLLKMGYDPQYSAASPSQVLCALIIEEATRHGDRCIDFLGAEEPWKREWTAEVQAHSWLYLFRPGLKTWSLRRAKFTLAPLVRDRLLPLLARGGRSGATRQPAQSPAPEAGSP